MIAALARFVEALRAEGHAVSPAELLDASRALEWVGVERRADVRSALRATLAKDQRAVDAFDKLFDQFFATPKFPAKGEGRGRAGERGTLQRKKPKDDAESKRKRAQEPKRKDAKLSELPQRVGREGSRRNGRLRRVKLRPATRDETDPAKRDLARRMTTEQEREVAHEVPRIVSALKLRVSRRGAAARAGRPWLRRALRDNLKHGGVPFVIPYRAPKRKTTRVVLLVDVSFSVTQAAGLFLLMASRFVELGRRARVLVFVDRPVDATAAIRRWARDARLSDGADGNGVTFADVLQDLRELNLHAPSDYGTAFHALRAPRIRPRGRDTVLVVLGDGRTNRFDPLPWALSEVTRGCRAVLWLASEPRSRWGTADSALLHYIDAVDVVVEANDLLGLASGLHELVRRL